MTKITKEEFLKRLKEDKYHDNIEEHIEYRLPVLQYYLDNLVNVQILTNKGPSNLRGLQIERMKQNNDFLLINQAFQSLTNRIKEWDTEEN